MARKKTGGGAKVPAAVDPAAMGLRAEVLEQPITETLETNYMPYAMSVIEMCIRDRTAPFHKGAKGRGYGLPRRSVGPPYPFCPFGTFPLDKGNRPRNDRLF